MVDFFKKLFFGGSVSDADGAIRPNVTPID